MGRVHAKFKDYEFGNGQADQGTNGLGDLLSCLSLILLIVFFSFLILFCFFLDARPGVPENAGPSSYTQIIKGSLLKNNHKYRHHCNLQSFLHLCLVDKLL